MSEAVQCPACAQTRFRMRSEEAIPEIKILGMVIQNGREPRIVVTCSTCGHKMEFPHGRLRVLDEKS